jgi:hypothetical protein
MSYLTDPNWRSVDKQLIFFVPPAAHIKLKYPEFYETHPKPHLAQPPQETASRFAEQFIISGGCRLCFHYCNANHEQESQQESGQELFYSRFARDFKIKKSLCSSGKGRQVLKISPPKNKIDQSAKLLRAP